MALRLALLITGVTVISYAYMVRSLEELARESLSKYVRERGQREEGIFRLAVDNHHVLVREFLARYLSDMPVRPLRLDRGPDGNWRSPRNSRYAREDTGVFIQGDAPITTDLKRRLAIGAELVSELGPAFHPRFQDTYVSVPEAGIAVYWPEAPRWVHEIKRDYRIDKEEWFRVGQPANNPRHRTVWTGAFMDSVSDSWMVSAATPVMVGNQVVATVHHDLMLDEILDRTVHDRLDGSTNYLIHEDGRVIARPRGDARELGSEIERIRLSGATGRMFDTPGWSGDWISVYQIQGPNWYFVAVYPKALIRRSAMGNAVIVLLLGVIALVLELAVVWWVLRNQITDPLRELGTATRRIAEGDFSVELDPRRDDELGQFTKSFMRMKKAVEDRDRELEHLVDKRTRELEQARARNVQAAKMSALGEMAGGIAHEINNPVAIITAKSAQMREQIDRGMLSPEQIKSGLSRIEATAMRVAQIVRGLRTFSRTGESDPLNRTRIRAIVEETLSFCREKLRADGIELLIDVDDLEVDCRATQISQVLLNLIVNSQDAVKDLPEKWILIEAKEVDGAVRVAVQDSGGGIAPEVVDKLMTPFFTTKEIGKGTGLGLSISRGIIEDHRGKLYYDDASSRTKFIFELPG